MLRFVPQLVAVYAALGGSGAPAQAPLLQKAGTIPVEGVKGEFDHFAIDLAHHRLYLAAEDQKTVEVLDLTTQKRIGSISLFQRPHGLIFLENTSTLVVADGGDGTVKFIDTKGPKLSSQIKTALRADAVAFDSDSNTAYVANGGLVANMDYSLVTSIDTAHAEQLGEVRIDSKILEAMAVEKSGPRLFVNLMDKKNVTVIGRVRQQILATWPLTAEQPSAMALDQPRHRLFVACRKPGRLVVLDTQSGKQIVDLPCVGHADDAHYDAVSRRIYISGGEGAVSVYQQRSPDEYTLLGTVETGPGAKTSLFAPELKRLFVAVPAGPPNAAQVLIFSTGEQPYDGGVPDTSPLHLDLIRP